MLVINAATAVRFTLLVTAGVLQAYSLELKVVAQARTIMHIDIHMLIQ